MRLLLVEDDPDLGPGLREDLSARGFAVDLATDGVDAQYLGESEPYDLVILDLGLPKRPGLQVLRAWRAAGIAVPVLVLTARGAWQERVEGFRAGADDYLPKPFQAEELHARIEALLRRAHGHVSGSKLHVAGLSLDEDHQRVISDDGKLVELTGTEFRLLRYMMLNSGKVLSKSRLAEHVYDFDSERDSNVLEVYVNRLRSKLGRDLITTRRGQGYVFGKSQDDR